MKIGSIDLDREVLVVAEIGNNHEGDVGRAREMIEAAAGAGAKAVKFQTIVPERLVSASQVARIQQLGRFALSREQFEKLADAAHAAGVMFLSTPFDPGVVTWLDPLVPAFKIASGDLNYERLLERVVGTGKPILLSTGMATLEEIRRACATIDACARTSGKSAEIVVLHCVSAYPTPPEQANLAAIATLARELGRPVGYSDHTLGIDAAMLSVALGARVIEKHFTLSKTFSDFRDHALSADPYEFAKLIRAVQQAERVLGSGVKAPQQAEVATALAARRSVVASSDLPAGHRLTIEDVDWLRPGGGLAPGQERLLLGRTLQRAVARGEMLTAEMVN